jgi:hypothetical protein
MLAKWALYRLSQHQLHFALVIFEMASHELFAQAGLEL